MTENGAIEDLEGTLRPWLLVHKAWWRRTYSAYGQRAWLEVMCELYQAIRSTAPLLLTAADTADQLSPEYRAFAHWCREHATEETDHEKWLLDDLSSVGVDTLALSRRTPSQEIAQFIGTQFLLATSNEPAALLGYFYLGECHPADPAALEQQRRDLGLPASAIRTLVFHAQEDQEHQREIRELVVRYGPAAFQGMTASAIAYVDAWTRIYRRISAQLGSSPDAERGGAG